MRRVVPGLAAIGCTYVVIALLTPERGWTALLIRGGIVAVCIALGGAAILSRRRRVVADPVVDSVS
jgi:mannose/fructose/N-acetylgalactosamine-specific phosphotransferase system component IID